jgi:hypothetical protein
VSFIAFELLQQLVKAVSVPTPRQLKALPGKIESVPRQAPVELRAPVFDGAGDVTVVTVLSIVEGSRHGLGEHIDTPEPVSTHGCPGCPGQLGAPLASTTHCWACMGQTEPAA